MRSFVWGLLVLVLLSPAAAVADPAPQGRNPSGPPYAVDVTADVRYGSDREGFHPALLDVYSPVGAGPWPTVVMFHSSGGQFADKSNVAVMATVVASQGAVVFAPNVGGPSTDADSREFRILTDTAAQCATSFALSRAGDYRADPELLTLTGFSGGANAAAMVALQDEPAEKDFCAVQPRTVTPDSLVLWEGDYLLAPWWDDVLEENPTFYADEWIWGRIGSSPLAAEWHLMFGELDRVASQRLPVGDPFGTGDECGRPLGGEPGIVPTTGTMCRFFDLRDPGQALRRDLDRLGAFDDGWLGIGEYSLLLAERLAAAGASRSMSIVEGATHSNLTVPGAELFARLVLDGAAATCDGWVATMVGTAGPDVMEGTDGPDVIVGRNGDDTIRGFAGNDVVCGGGGRDTVFGGPGDDRLLGQDGRDALIGGPGDDELGGGNRWDTLLGGKGADTLRGGDWGDQLMGGDGPDDLFGGRGRDFLRGGPGSDVLRGGRWDDFLQGNLDDDVLIGARGHDRLEGGAGEDHVAGGPGDDDLRGSAGDDDLFGEGGDDALDGGPGRDACSGGPGENMAVRCEAIP